ncbi:RNA dependent RNA polymerase-domain-containing protein [Fomitopsis serialis]|uniref:RNA dependent RNA polymerase-domain-containing protein n=1 Tax=Fomitopsis serialis TaxID=139415 RepID=UPI0020089260|nr:RNA dependent RNA polymerase-domain-containing protein [Neoantrodia serialis]KAH9916863.1 RNA dependent RNA polymerase-domain-containing protein [Neoantrodia serialis]
MEVFMRGIPFSMEQPQLKEVLARIFHSSDYTQHSSRPLNFEVRILRKANKRGARSGIITVPTQAIGEQFLRQNGDGSSTRHDGLATITFERGRNAPNRRVLEAILGKPYQSPTTVSQPPHSRDSVSIARLQFGWVCRNEEYSVEWETSFPTAGSALLTYKEDRRQFQLKVMDAIRTRIMTVRASQVYWNTASADQSGESSILLWLLYPPSFEAGPPDPERVDEDETDDFLRGFSMRQLLEVLGNRSFKIQRKRQGAFDDTHLPVAPYTSIAVRLVCSNAFDVAIYKRLCRVAHLPVDLSPYPVVHRGLFSDSVRAAYQRWTATLDFAVAFQLELLRPNVDHMVSRYGADVASALLADLKTRLEARVWYGDGVDIDEDTVKNLLTTCIRQLNRKARVQPLPHSDLFMCNHLYVTASAFVADGPSPERSNRVIRRYWDHRDCFLRVHFTDDNQLAYRYDAEINLQDLVDRRVKRFLLEGVSVAGQRFEFLGYSQSALKSHSVWFVKPFKDTDGRTIDAATIIDGLGSFADNPYDPQLIFCPARYAARISQAFSATESSIAVAVEDMEIIDDIKDRTGTYSFTDGNGTMSLQVARDIAADQRSKSRVRRAWRGSIPRVIQVRIAGSKGMLHVDHRMEGGKIRLPRSMVKFAAPTSNSIEIAQVFEEPSPFYLNRPMIMLLEGLGVPYEVFRRLQDDTVRATHTLTESLANSGWLLEMHGLVAELNAVGYWQRAMTFAVNHYLVVDLVGVADFHGQLREGEIYARVKPTNGHEVVHAIGKPPEGSDLAKGDLKNCIVFSTRGERPLPSYLGGGDLDGDMYNVTCPCQRKILPQPSTMRDVADFVAEFIISDNVGIVASTWLILADRVGIFDPHCLRLAELHNAAVDYPKTGLPVSINEVRPMQKLTQEKPDWYMPETITGRQPRYYQSTSALGRLFRAIDLPDQEERNMESSYFGLPEIDEEGGVTLQDVLIDITDNPFNHRAVLQSVTTEVRTYLGRYRPDEPLVTTTWNLFIIYASRLREICATHAVSASRSSMLSEEEVIIGTISAKCAQTRKRTDMTAKLREQTATLVNGICAELSGDEGIAPSTHLKQAWTAYRVSCTLSGWFGGQSFGWIALGELFDAIREVQEEDRESVGGLPA